MRTADELMQETETLAREYAELIGGVQEDGNIDMDEAILGREYAETYRKQLAALRREARAAIKEVRATYRGLMREARANAVSVGRGREAANLLGEEQVELTHPYYAVLLRLDSLLTDAQLSKATFLAASEKLRDTGADAILIPKISQISVEDEDEDDAEEAEAATPQAAAQADAQLDLSADLAEQLRDSAGRWQALLSEANDRLVLDETSPQASHLRGIKKALELALDDIEGLLASAQPDL